MHLCFSLVDQIGYDIKPAICAKSWQNLVLYFISFNAHYLYMLERTTRYREIGHIIVLTLFPVVYCVKVCYPLLWRYINVVNTHSLNIRSFYASHFCNNKKTPKEKKQKQTNNKNKTKEKNPPKTNKQKRSSSVSVLKVKTLYKQYVCHE